MPDQLDPGVLYGPDDDRSQPPELLRATSLGTGRVAVIGVVPGSMRLAIQAASAWQQEGAKAAAGLARIGDSMRSLSMAMTNLDPELLRLLTGLKPRRGWKGHGAPPIYPSQRGRRG